MVTDKKENELTAASTFEYVRALDAAGNSIRINKNDFAKVLEGLTGFHKEEIASQNVVEIRLKTRSIVSVTLFHLAEKSRAPEVAIVGLCDDGYYVHRLLATNMGMGVKVSDNGDCIIVDGMKSHKRVICTVIYGSIVSMTERP